MGYYQTAYVAYGAELAGNAYELWYRVEEEHEFDFSRYEDLGILFAGPYDNDFLFLTTFCEEAELGEYKTILWDADKEAEWSRMIRYFAEENGLTLAGSPGWFVVSDYS